MNHTYLLNDPSTPNFVKEMPIPSLNPVHAPFTVEGFNGGGHAIGTPEWQAAQCYVTVAIAQNWYQTVTPTPLQTWPGTSNLLIKPRAGRDFNAHYDRNALCFFYDHDKIRDKTIYTCDSVDIVAHELGHAILDAIRPDLWNCPTLEGWSFHEAFADLIAMLNVMQFDEVLLDMLKETNNTLGGTNMASRLAEEMGLAIHNLLKSRGVQNPAYNPTALRDAVNGFAYANPARLPKDGPPDVLAAEPHSFGRVFLGAFYDILVGIFKKEIVKDGNALEALKRARHMTGYLASQAITGAPLTPRFYDAMAKTMLQIDKNIGSPNADVLIWAFSRRRLVKFQFRAMSNLKLTDLNINSYKVEELEDHVVLRKNEVTTIKLKDHVLRAQANDPLVNAAIEVPCQTYMKFDKHGNLIDEISATKKDILDSVKLAVKHLKDRDLYEIEPTHSKPFAIENGKLIRQFIN